MRGGSSSMIQSVSSANSVDPVGQSRGLKSNVVGLLGAATLGVVMLSPAMTLYGGFGPAFLSAGKAAPLAFVWALIATIPTAISYAVLSREYPVSGSAASWASRAVSPRIGVWAGWMVFFYYFANFIIQPVTLGVFLHDLLVALHVPLSILASYFLGVVVCCAWPAWMVYRGISISAKGALAFLLCESLVVIALCLTIAFVAPKLGAHFSADGFKISSSPTGTSGLFKAMVFSMLAYCGFDVVSTLAEETKMARKLIPQATLLSLLVYAVLIIGGIWSLTYGADAQVLKAVAEKGEMPIQSIAQSFWGKGSILVTVTAVSASLGLAIATAVGASRVLFAMGREGSASPVFARLHSGYQVPWNTLHLIFLGGLGAALVAGILVGPYNAYVWWCSTSTFFAMITYLFVNWANLVLFRDRVFKSATGFLLYGLVPILGLAADIFILIRTFFVELWSQGWATGQSVIVFDLLCGVLALIFAIRAKRKKPSASVKATADGDGAMGMGLDTISADVNT